MHQKQNYYIRCNWQAVGLSLIMHLENYGHDCNCCNSINIHSAICHEMFHSFLPPRIRCSIVYLVIYNKFKRLTPQDSVATYCRCGGNCYIWLCSKFYALCSNENIVKINSVKVWQSYGRLQSGKFGGDTAWMLQPLQLILYRLLFTVDLVTSSACRRWRWRCEFDRSTVVKCHANVNVSLTCPTAPPVRYVTLQCYADLTSLFTRLLGSVGQWF